MVNLNSWSPLCRDYRCGPYPARGYDMQHSHNHAVMTYRGHEVLQTLIRAYWSPAHSTAQRYLYTGDPNGHITIYGAPSFGAGCLCSVQQPSALPVRSRFQWHLAQLSSSSSSSMACRATCAQIVVEGWGIESVAAQLGSATQLASAAVLQLSCLLCGCLVAGLCRLCPRLTCALICRCGVWTHCAQAGVAWRHCARHELAPLPAHADQLSF